MAYWGVNLGHANVHKVPAKNENPELNPLGLQQAKYRALVLTVCGGIERYLICKALACADCTVMGHLGHLGSKIKSVACVCKYCKYWRSGRENPNTYINIFQLKKKQ